MLTPKSTEVDQILEIANQHLAQGTFDVSDSQLLEKMVASLGDSRALTRLALITILAKIGPPVAPFLIEAVAHHPNPLVRRSAGKCLAKIKYPQAVPVLINILLNDQDLVVRSSITGALAKMGPIAVPALLDLIAGDYPESIKGLGAWALTCIGSEAAEELYHACKSDQVNVRIVALSAIGSLVIHSKDTPINDLETKRQEILINALQEPELPVRLEAINAIGKLADTIAINHLIPLVDDPDLQVRHSAVVALGNLGHHSALPVLETKLNDPLSFPLIPILKIAIYQITI